LYWPAEDMKIIRNTDFSFITEHLFYYEQFHPHLKRLKNMESWSPEFAPFDVPTDEVIGVAYPLFNFVSPLQKHGFQAFWDKVRT
jgi:hypothetical protein